MNIPAPRPRQPARPTALRLLAAVALGVAGVATVARARPVYHPQLLEQFQLEDDLVARRASCAYCHASAERVEGLNPFGRAVLVALAGGGEERLGEALHRTLRAGRDADGDGYRDALEVVARTLPGDPRSRPVQSRAALEKRLRALGGPAYFRSR